MLFAGSRFWFPLMIATAISLPVVINKFFHKFGYYGLIPLASLLMILSGLINLERFLECGNCKQDFSALLKGHSINQTIERPGWTSRTAWSIALGQYNFQKSECVSQVNDSVFKSGYHSVDLAVAERNYNFLVHCSGSYIIVYTKNSQTEYNGKDNNQQEPWGPNVWNNIQKTKRGADPAVSNAVLLKSMLRKIQAKL